MKKPAKGSSKKATIRGMKPGEKRNATARKQGSTMRLSTADIEKFDRLSGLTGISRYSEIMRFAVQKLLDTYPKDKA